MIRRLALFAFLICLFPRLASALPLIRDAEIEHTLRTYADPIFKVAGLKPEAIKIFIVQDDALNAFVAGGSNMFIHTGLIKATDTPDMLIGVIAHETGHIAGGHLARGAEKLKNAQLGTIFTYVLGAAAAAASGKPEAAAAVITGGSTALGRNFLSYTRSHEEAADQSAVNSLDQLHISSGGMLKVFTLLQRDQRMHPGSPDPYLQTHPLTSQRMEFIREHIGKSGIPDGQYPKAYDALHKRMVAKLYGFLESPERTMQKYPLNDKSVAARLARSVAYYKIPDLTKSLAEIDSLIAEAPNDAFFHELKGQILFENGRVAEALPAYRQAAKLMPDSALILTDLGRVELAQKTPPISEAIVHLEKAVHLDNSNATTWRQLAIAYGKANNMGMSYLALAEEAMLSNDPVGALKQVEYALSNLKDRTPAKQRALDIKTRAIELKREKDESENSF